jgi:hypothetical protein
MRAATRATRERESRMWMRRRAARKRLAPAFLVGVRTVFVSLRAHRRVRAERQPQHQRCREELDKPHQREQKPQSHQPRCYYRPPPLSSAL